ncbi:MAG TPA: hypothetical protein VHS80_01945 [Chthoniobacterales bacterium]|nr:hypothetical protein [Chthoniobacterales bacterium]
MSNRRLAFVPRIADWALRELAMAVVRQQHYADSNRKHHRRRLFVGTGGAAELDEIRGHPAP